MVIHWSFIENLVQSICQRIHYITHIISKSKQTLMIYKLLKKLKMSEVNK